MAVGLPLLIMLSACTDADFSLSAKDAYGAWRAGSGLPAQLHLGGDGTFQATDWPLDVGCDGRSAYIVSSLVGAETADFSGTWEEGDGGSLNTVTLHPESTECPVSWIDADFRSENGVLYMCLDLGMHPDEAAAENYLILHLGDPEDVPDPERCFNYH